jgi:hypothetical protein
MKLRQYLAGNRMRPDEQSVQTALLPTTILLILCFKSIVVSCYLSFSCAAILTIEFRRIGAAAAGLDAVALASRCVGLSGAEIAALCREAALVAMEEDMHARQLHARHFEVAFTRVTPRITPQMLRFYADYAARATVASV